jgi:hypothetical protein
MADDMVTVPADAVHAVLAVFARITHLAGSDAVRVLRDAVPEQDRTRAQLVVCVAERERVVRDLKRRRDQAPPGVIRDTWIAALGVVLGDEEP